MDRQKFSYYVLKIKYKFYQTFEMFGAGIFKLGAKGLKGGSQESVSGRSMKKKIN